MDHALLPSLPLFRRIEGCVERRRITTLCPVTPPQLFQEGCERGVVERQAPRLDMQIKEAGQDRRQVRGDVNAFREEDTYGEPTNGGGISDIFAKSIDKLCPSERS